MPQIAKPGSGTTVASHSASTSTSTPAGTMIQSGTGLFINKGMKMNRIEVNVTTGEKRVIPLTKEELEEIASRPKQEAPVKRIDRLTSLTEALIAKGVLSEDDIKS